MRFWTLFRSAQCFHSNITTASIVTRTFIRQFNLTVCNCYQIVIKIFSVEFYQKRKFYSRICIWSNDMSDSSKFHKILASTSSVFLYFDTQVLPRRCNLLADDRNIGLNLHTYKNTAVCCVDRVEIQIEI